MRKKVQRHQRVTKRLQVKSSSGGLSFTGILTNLSKNGLFIANSVLMVAYEAGPCGFWLYDRLMSEGVETIVVPPSLVPVESGNRVKTDKRDSRKLACLLEGNMLKRVHILTEEERAQRELIRTRGQLVEHQSDVARQIKSKLLFYGIRSPFPGRSKWTKRFLSWLKGIVFKEEVLKKSFDSLIQLYEYLKVQIKEISKEVIALWQSKQYKKRVDILRSVPGVGILSAMEILW